MRGELMQIRNSIDLSMLGEHLCVAFDTWRIPTSRVVWLNKRWWLSQGYDLHNIGVHNSVSRHILNTFGVKSERDTSSSLRRILTADRYGGTVGTLHGGSGRVGSSGGLNAKGIGPTPLVPKSLTDHSDGALSLVEAIREAICAEVASVELPYGAVPVVAIIACDPLDMRQGIVVRPNFIRPAHFERSIFFGSSGFVGSDQWIDAVRVKDMASFFALSGEGSNVGTQITGMFSRLSQMCGAAFANRLWQGKFLTSNVTICGEMVDFGSFRAVDSWSAYYGEAEEVFGGEPAYIRAAFSSVLGTFRKYGFANLPNSADIHNFVAKEFKKGFAGAVSKGIDLYDIAEPFRANLIENIWAYARLQNRIHVQIGDSNSIDRHDLGSVLVGFSPRGNRLWPSLERNANEIANVFADIEIVHGVHRTDTLRRYTFSWLRPRPRLSYELGTKEIRHLLIDLINARGDVEGIIQRFISQEVYHA